MPAISTNTSDKGIGTAGTLSFNFVLSVSSIQVASALMLSEDLARASSARSRSFAVLPTVETVGEAGRVLQAGSLACFHCQTVDGGFPLYGPHRFLQHMRSQEINKKNENQQQTDSIESGALIPWAEVALHVASTNCVFINLRFQKSFHTLHCMSLLSPWGSRRCSSRILNSL